VYDLTIFNLFVVLRTMKVNSFAAVVNTPQKSENEVPGEKLRSSPSAELGSLLQKIDRLHQFCHSSTIESIDSFKLRINTRNKIREIFDGFDEKISLWIIECEKTCIESGKFSLFFQEYVHFEFRVKKDHSFLVLVLLNYMKMFSVTVDEAYLDLFKLNVEKTYCPECSKDHDLRIQKLNLSYLRQKILSDTDSCDDSGSDKEFELCEENVESSSDESSANESEKRKPKERTEDEITSNEDKKMHCNPFHSGSESDDVYSFKEEVFTNPFLSSEDELETVEKMIQCKKTSTPQTSSVDVKLNKQAHECDYCEGKFHSKHNLKIHLVGVHRIFPDGMKVFECPEQNCKFVTGSRICYTRHAATHLRKPKVKSNTPKLSCSYCQMVVANRSSLRRHVKRKHNDI
jgi:hypothetical protein